MRPDVTTYNTLLSAWSRIGGKEPGVPERAEEILDRMISLRRAGDRSCGPDERSFLAAINCWAKSREPSKARRARDLLRRMEGGDGDGDDDDGIGGLRLRPNVYVYGAVLNACAHTRRNGPKSERDEALTVALETFSELRKSPHASGNHVTYAAFIRACGALMDDDDVRRRPLLDNVFRRCCLDGMVCDSVLDRLYAAAPPDLTASLLGEAIIRRGRQVAALDLPAEWTRNALGGSGAPPRRRRGGKIHRKGGNASLRPLHVHNGTRGR